MATTNKKIDADGNTIIDVNIDTDDQVTLATANTYVDKNIVFNIDSKKWVLKTGDTMTGQLKFNTTQLPIIDLHMTNQGSNVYTMTTNGSLFIGDGTSTGGARVYYCRKVENLNAAVLSAVSVGYNPLDQSHWASSKDYGIKFDTNIAPMTAQPSALRQVASFFVGVNGAVVGYSGDASKAISNSTIYKVLDSHNITENEYIISLEQRIADLEAKLNAINTGDDTNL